MLPALRYAVVLTDVSALRPAAIAKALAPLKNLPMQDLLVPLRGCWGVVTADAEEAQARLEAEALRAAGIPALAIPISLIEELPEAEPPGALGDVKPRLLAAAVFKVKSVRRVKEQQGPDIKDQALKLGLALATGLPIGLGGKKEVERSVESSELVYFLDVYFGAPVRRWRVDAQDFDYSVLGERMGYDAAGNFRRLLELLAPRSAALNRGAEGLLSGRPVRELGYEGLADLEREARWLLTLSALKPG